MLMSLEKGVHLIPSRTQKLSPSSPMILGDSPGKVGRRQHGAFFYLCKSNKRIVFLQEFWVNPARHFVPAGQAWSFFYMLKIDPGVYKVFFKTTPGSIFLELKNHLTNWKYRGNNVFRFFNFFENDFRNRHRFSFE